MVTPYYLLVKNILYEFIKIVNIHLYSNLLISK